MTLTKSENLRFAHVSRYYKRQVSASFIPDDFTGVLELYFPMKKFREVLEFAITHIFLEESFRCICLSNKVLLFWMLYWVTLGDNDVSNNIYKKEIVIINCEI